MGTEPDKAQAPLAINADAVLSSSVALERFQLVARWHPQEGQIGGRVQLLKFAHGGGFHVGKASHLSAFKQCLRVLASKVDQHGNDNEGR